MRTRKRLRSLAPMLALSLALSACGEKGAAPRVVHPYGPAPTADQARLAESIHRRVCSTCHGRDPLERRVGPSFHGLGARMDATELRRWILDPQAMKPGTPMPAYGGSEREIDALIAWLRAPPG